MSKKLLSQGKKSKGESLEAHFRTDTRKVTNRLLKLQTERWMDGWIDDGWMDDRQIDRQIDRCFQEDHTENYTGMTLSMCDSISQDTFSFKLQKIQSINATNYLLMPMCGCGVSRVHFIAQQDHGPAASFHPYAPLLQCVGFFSLQPQMTTTVSQIYNITSAIF